MSASSGRSPDAPSRGRVSLVGAGPGDPELLTFRAARLIREADVIVNDRLVHPGVLALARARTRIFYSGKEAGVASPKQDDINALLVAQARLGRHVVRLKGGDPFVFGRGAEEALALEAAGIPYEIVPGVSSGLAAPAAAAIPLTHRGVARTVTFATATLADGEANWSLLAQTETLVLFMANHGLDAVLQRLVTAGRAASTPAAIIEAATWAHERVIVGTLHTLAARARAEAIGSPALVIVGHVVALREQLASLAGRALAGASPEIERSSAPRPGGRDAEPRQFPPLHAASVRGAP